MDFLKQRRDTVIVILGVAILTPVAVAAIGYAVFRHVNPPFHARPFDRSSWLSKPKSRGTMLDDLLSSSGPLKRCADRASVTSLLGQPSHIQPDRTYVYEVGRYRLDPGDPLYLSFDRHWRLTDAQMPIGSASGSLPTGTSWTAPQPC